MADSSKTVGLHELYAKDSQEADRVVFGRVANANRRGFLKGAGLGTMAAAVGASIPFHALMPAGLIPAALGASDESVLLKTKSGLTVLNDKPINIETPAHLLDDDVTPNGRHFVRNNGLVPEAAIVADAKGYTLTIEGAVEKVLTLTLEDLKTKFEVVTRELVIECGGNGRAYFNPGASGNQWTLGAVANSSWTGVRLADVLKAAGLKKSAFYTAHHSSDLHLSRDPNLEPISRGVPIAKAMDENNLIAFEMNGKPLPALHGFPVRLVVPGWPGSCSQKWLTRIEVRDVKHDGPKMGAPSYSVPKNPVAPGGEVPEGGFKTIEAMPLKSIITRPATGVRVAAGQAVGVRGHAWVGDQVVKSMDVSIDFGQTWISAELDGPANAHAWQNWRAEVTLPVAGYYEVWARATDSDGVSQPAVTPGWNPKGYLNNMQHRIALIAT